MTWRQFLSLTRFDKPIGIWLLLWPTLSALWLVARGFPGWNLLLIFALGTALTRAAGCVVNDMWDKDFDRHVARTRERVLTSGAVSMRQSLIVTLALLILAVLLIIPLNSLAQLLALAAAVIAATYPLFKRFFPFPQAYLGLAFSMGILMAYAAWSNTIPIIAWILLVANVAWTLAYDTEYAMVDKEDDRHLGLRSSALSFGQYDRVIVALCYALHLLIWLSVASIEHLNPWFFVFWSGAIIIAIVHVRWIWSRDRMQCLRAFRHNHWLGMMIFVSVLTSV